MSLKGYNMSILDIDLETNIIDFSKPNKNGRVYDSDSIKIPDNYTPPDSVQNSDDYTRPFEVIKVSDKLPKVGIPNGIYDLNGNLYMYTEYGKWCDLSARIEGAKKVFEKRMKEIMYGEYNNENNL
jgi:hypothetical protein